MRIVTQYAKVNAAGDWVEALGGPREHTATEISSGARTKLRAVIAELVALDQAADPALAGEVST